MKVTCSGCNKSYVIPDEKIPADKALKLPCPDCKTIIIVKKNSDTSVPQPKPQATETGDKKPLLTGDELKNKIVKTSRAMPPMPQILTKATEVMSDDTKGFKEIGEVLETDQAMATRVLKIANSAYYSLSVPVASVQQASALLGCQALLELITVVSTSKIMGQSLAGYGFSSENVWKHSLMVATCSKQLADMKFPSLSNDAFNAGLIHDSGMIILDEYVVDRKDQFGNITFDEKELIKQEAAVFGFNHAEIAADFFIKWKLPSTQTHAIRYHHAPSQSGNDDLAYILHLADCIAGQGNNLDNIRAYAEEGTLDHIHISPEEIETIHTNAVASVAAIIASITG